MSYNPETISLLGLDRSMEERKRYLLPYLQEPFYFLPKMGRNWGYENLCEVLKSSAAKYEESFVLGVIGNEGIFVGIRPFRETWKKVN